MQSPEQSPEVTDQRVCLVPALVVMWEGGSVLMKLVVPSDQD